MKKLTLLFFAIFIGLAGLLSAQKQFSGSIKTSYKIEGTEDPNILSKVPEENEMIILGNKSKIVFSSQGGAQTIIVDGDKKTQTVLFEINGYGKYYTVVDEEKMQKKFQTTDYKYDYLEEYMTIAGYNCQKVIVTETDLETDEVESMVVYINKEICNTDAHNFNQLPGLLGFVLRQELNMGEENENAILIIEAKEVNTGKKIKDFDFMLPSDAKDLFKDTTPDEKKFFGITDEDED